MVSPDEQFLIKKINGNEEVRRFLENLGFVNRIVRLDLIRNFIDRGYGEFVFLGFLDAFEALDADVVVLIFRHEHFGADGLRGAADL